MCGKFTYMATWAEVVAFSQPLTKGPSNAPEETATPMRWAPVMHLDAAGERTMTQMRWGFSKVGRDGKERPDIMHARDDKVLLPFWRKHLEARRGLLIVTSFNEGEEVPTLNRDGSPTGKTKTVQWTIRPKDGSRLAIAVLYREIERAVGPVLEFVMCTTRANQGISEFVTGDPDKRMAAVVAEDDIPLWLGELRAPMEDVRDVLRTYEDDGAWDMTRQGKTKDLF